MNDHIGSNSASPAMSKTAQALPLIEIAVVVLSGFVASRVKRSFWRLLCQRGCTSCFIWKEASWNSAPRSAVGVTPAKKDSAHDDAAFRRTRRRLRR